MPLNYFDCRGRITFYTHPPEERSLPSHVSADIVKEWGKAFDLKSLIEEEKKELSGKLDVRGLVQFSLTFLLPLLLIFEFSELHECTNERQVFPNSSCCWS